MLPLYDYSDSEEGISITLRRPVEDRDKPIVLKRAKTVPDSVNVLVPGGTTKDMNFNQRIRKSFYKLEQEKGSRFLGSETTPIKSKAKLAELWKDQPNETRS